MVHNLIADLVTRGWLAAPDAPALAAYVARRPGLDLASFLLGRGLLNEDQADALSRPDHGRAGLVAALEARLSEEPLFAAHARAAYEARSLLGRGGMGVVELVWDSRLGREVARKVAHLEAGPTEVARFLREARVMAGLDHPQIPPVYEFGIDVDGLAFLTMPVIRGETLEARIQRYAAAGELEARRAELLEILKKVCEAISYAHSVGVLHRDLKPSNIMVGTHGEVYVMDWGLARRGGSGEGDELAVTQAGEVLGTPGYMPPEQAEGDAVSEGVDVFALGAILVRCLTGERAIPGDGVLQRLKATVKGEQRSPRELDSRVPKELDSLARRAMASVPAARLGSVAELGRDLEAWLYGRPVRAHAYSALERTQRLLRRRAGVIAAAGLTVASLAAAAVALERARSRDELARVAEERRREARSDAEFADLLRAQNKEAFRRFARLFFNTLRTPEALREDLEAIAATGEDSAEKLYLVAKLAAENPVLLLSQPEETLERAKGWAMAAYHLDPGLTSAAVLAARCEFQMELSNDDAPRLCERLAELGVGARDPACAAYLESVEAVGAGQPDRALGLLTSVTTHPELGVPARLLRISLLSDAGRREAKDEMAALLRVVRPIPGLSMDFCNQALKLKDTELALTFNALAELVDGVSVESLRLSLVPLADAGHTERLYERVLALDERGAATALDSTILADAWSLEGKWAAAIVAARRARELDPEALAPQAIEAEALASAFDFRAAKPLLDEIEKRPLNAGLAARCGRALILCGAPERALALVKDQRSEDVREQALLDGVLGRALCDLREHARAIEPLTRAIAFKPTWELLVARGRCHRTLGYAEEGLKDIQAAMGLSPYPASVSVEQVPMLAQLGRWREVVVELKTALARGRYVSLALTGLARERLANGDLAQAREPLEMAFWLDNQSPAACEALGRYQLAAGQTERAAQTFARLLALTPDGFDARLLRALAHVELGESTDALAQLSELRRRHPQHPRRLEVDDLESRARGEGR